MQRVYGLVDEELVHRIDEKAGEEKVSRAQWVRIAIEAYLHRGGEQESLETVNLRNEAVKLREEAVNLSTAFDEKGQKIAHLKDELAVKDGELAVKIDELDRLKRDHDKTLSEATQRWDELKGFRREIDKLKKELEEAGSSNQRLKDELLKRQAETDLLAKVREELAATKSDRDRLQEAMRVRDDDVAWLRGHVAQLTQQMALPPSQEEAKKKGWWQFWR